MKKNEVELLINVLLIFSIFLSITGFFTDVSNTVKYGGVDLRNRVVGARLALLKMDPYFFKWQKGNPEELLDPRDQPYQKVNRVTVPPSVLLIHTPIAKLSYRNQRFIWLLFQWLLFISSLILFSKSTKDKFKSKLIWIIGLFFVGSSFYWRLHVERGQIYILYVFLISLAYWIYQRKIKYNDLLSGMVIGYAIILRPPIIMLNIPMLIYKKWKFLLGNIFGVIIGFSSSLLLFPFSTWIKYYSAMQRHGILHTGIVETASGRYPFQNIEGIMNLWAVPNIPIFDSSIQGLFKDFFGIIISSQILLVSLICTMLICSIIIYKFRVSKINTSTLFLAGSILILISEFFIPAARYSYSNVIWLVILSLIIINSKEILSLLKK